MNKNIKIIIGVLLIAVIATGAVFGIKTYSEVAAKEKADSVAVAQVNGVNITKGEFELAKKNVAKNGLTMTDKDVLNKLILNEALTQEAEKNGFKISEAEVKEITKAQKEKIESGDGKDKFKDYLKEVGMSENAYWKDAEKKARNSNLRNQYKEHLKIEFAKENQIKDMNSLEAKFGDFYEEVASEVMSVAEIKIFVKV